MMYKEYIVPLREEENDCGLMVNAVIRVHPELIRCKDCKYSVDKYGDGDCYCGYNRILSYIGKNWNHYCGWAKRKEE